MDTNHDNSNAVAQLLGGIIAKQTEALRAQIESLERAVQQQREEHVNLSLSMRSAQEGVEVRLERAEQNLVVRNSSPLLVDLSDALLAFIAEQVRTAVQAEATRAVEEELGVVDIKDVIKDALTEHDLTDEIQTVVANFDFNDDIHRALDRYDFSEVVANEVESQVSALGLVSEIETQVDRAVDRAVEVAIDNLDLSDQIKEAVSDADLSDQIKEAVADTDLSDQITAAVGDADLDLTDAVRNALRRIAG